MKGLFHTIVNFGVDNSLSVLDKRRIKIINLLNLIVAFFLIIGLTNYFFIGPGYPIYVNIGFFFLCLFSLFLSKIKQNASAFVLFTVNVNGSIFFINQYYPQEAGAYLYYYTLIISVVLLNNPRYFDRFAVFHLLICGAFFIASLTIDIKELEVTNLSHEKIRVIWYYNVAISSIVTALLSVMLTRLISSQNREIVVQNEDLMKTKQEVDVSLKEKEVLLAELHHRVKNNLAIISGLLNMQGDATDNEEAKQVLSDSKSRIMSMALVHKMLYENQELKNINIGKYTTELVDELFNSYNILKKVHITYESDDLALPVSKSIPLGLILNEVVTNSIKYAFKPKQGQQGLFYIKIKKESDKVTMIVKDNGPGFPQDFNDNVADLSLGIYLIKTLAEQIDGTLLFSNENGAKITLTFQAN